MIIHIKFFLGIIIASLAVPTTSNIKRNHYHVVNEATHVKLNAFIHSYSYKMSQSQGYGYLITLCPSPYLKLNNINSQEYL